MFYNILDLCEIKKCGKNTDCTETGNKATCTCKAGFTGNPDEGCEKIGMFTYLSNMLIYFITRKGHCRATTNI